VCELVGELGGRLIGAADRSGAISELDQLRFAYRAQFHKRAPW
jgi:hypothetical protein